MTCSGKARCWSSTRAAGQDLGKAQSQAFQYLQDLLNDGRAKDAPRYVIVSDFARIALHDLEPEDGVRPSPGSSPQTAGARNFARAGLLRPGTAALRQPLEFPLADLHKHIHAFAFIPGYKQHRFADQDPSTSKPPRSWAICTTPWKAGATAATSSNASSSASSSASLRRTPASSSATPSSSTSKTAPPRTAPTSAAPRPPVPRARHPRKKRQKNLDETLAAFPYVNGELFREHDLDIPDFNRDMRNALLACTRFDWSAISPAIFGSLFQAVMEPRERRQIGGHYTSERDILKVIRSLFLDDLRAEFERIRTNKAELRRFHERLASLRFLDPACGCGNFLVITYRELRVLELEILEILYGSQRELTPT